MTRRFARAAFGGLALLVSGGGLIVPTAITGSPVSGPANSGTGAASKSAPAAPATSPSTGSTTPQQVDVVLTSLGVAGFDFGTAVTEVEPVLTQRLGKPERVFDGIACEMANIPTRTLTWQGLSVSFEAAPGKPEATKVLKQWQLRVARPLDARVKLGEDLPRKPSFSQLKGKYPTGKMTTELGWHIFRLPNGVMYLGETTAKPFMIQGGENRWCE